MLFRSIIECLLHLLSVSTRVSCASPLHFMLGPTTFGFVDDLDIAVELLTNAEAYADLCGSSYCKLRKSIVYHDRFKAWEYQIDLSAAFEIIESLLSSTSRPHFSIEVRMIYGNLLTTRYLYFRSSPDARLGTDAYIAATKHTSREGNPFCSFEAWSNLSLVCKDSMAPGMDSNTRITLAFYAAVSARLILKPVVES